MYYWDRLGESVVMVGVLVVAGKVAKDYYIPRVVKHFKRHRIKQYIDETSVAYEGFTPDALREAHQKIQEGIPLLNGEDTKKTNALTLLGNIEDRLTTLSDQLQQKIQMF